MVNGKVGSGKRKWGKWEVEKGETNICFSPLTVA